MVRNDTCVTLYQKIAIDSTVQPTTTTYFVGNPPKASMKLDSKRGRDPSEIALEMDDITDKSLSSAVVRTISSHKGEEIDAMPPIRERIQPEALDSLFETVLPNSSVQDTMVTFRYDGCRVTIFSTGQLRFDFSKNGS